SSAKRGRSTGRGAVALDGDDAEARPRLAIALQSRGDYQGGQAEAERALSISPNLADAHGALGVVLTFSGRPKEGLAALKICVRLDPRTPSLVHRNPVLTARLRAVSLSARTPIGHAQQDLSLPNSSKSVILTLKITGYH